MFWFGGNVNVFNVVLGGVLVSIGLTFWWAVSAIVIGTLIGALLIALHATQVPRLWVPQSIQSRGQFGFYGAAFMFPAVLVLNIGFIAAELVIQAQAMTGVTAALSMPEWIAVLAVPSAVIGIYGYRWIHRPHAGHRRRRRRVARHHADPGGAARVAAGRPDHLGPPVRRPVPRRRRACSVIDLLSFGPFVSDYTRYLPADGRGRRLFWAIYAGTSSATAWLLHHRRVPRRAAAIADPVDASARSPASGHW